MATSTAPNEQADSALAATPSPPIPIPLPPFGSALGPQSHHQTIQVEGNGDSVIRVQGSDGSIYLYTDTTSLLQTTPTTTSGTAQVAANIFYLDSYPADLLSGSSSVHLQLGQQALTTFGRALIRGNDTSSVTLQIAPMGSAATSTTSTSAAASELITDRKVKITVAGLLTTIATGAVISVASGLIGNENAELTHDILFKAFTMLCYFCLVSSISMLLLVSMPPNIPALETIVNLTTWIAVASFVYAIDCLACIQIQDDIGVIIALVVPFVLLSIIMILHFTHTRRRLLTSSG